MYLFYIFFIFMFISCIFTPLNGMKPKGIMRKLYRSFECMQASICRPGHVSVFMNDAKTIMLAPEVENSITISTTGLTGCIATLLYIKDKKKYKQAILTHFEPSDAYQKEHIVALEHQAKLLKKQMAECDLMKFIVIMPKCAYWSNKEAHDTAYNKMRNELEFVIKKIYSPINVPTLYASYALAPMGKGYTTDVYATLSHDPSCSVCIIRNWAQGQIFNLE